MENTEKTPNTENTEITENTDSQPTGKVKLADRKGFRIFKKIRSVFFTILLLAAVAVLVVVMIARIQGTTPSLFGYSVFRVSSGSMKPAYEIGDVIIVKQCDASELKVGDVVTYNGKSGDFAGKIVTHRVITAQFEQNGEKYIQTRGDANPLTDPDVNVKDIIGRTEAKIGFLKTVYDIFVTPWGLILLIALIIAAFFNEIVNFVKSFLGIGYEDEDESSIEDIIERYQKENQNKKDDEGSD